MELDLLNKIAKQDAKALEDFYVNYGRILYNTAYKVVFNEMDAEEIVNDVLAKIWNHAKMIIKLSNPMGYIVTMTHNLSIDYYRKNLKHMEKIQEYNVEDLKSEQDISFINTILYQLDEEQRTILILKCVYDYTYKEIALLTKLTLKQVRIRYEKAVNNYKKIYEEEEI